MARDPPILASWFGTSPRLVSAIFVDLTYRCSGSCSCALTFRFNLTYCNQNCLFPFIEFRFEVYRYRLMNHKLTVSHSLSGNEFSIAIFKILSKQESICARLSLTDSFNFVLQISINYFPNIILHRTKIWLGWFGHINVADGYWKRNWLATIWWCWWKLWPTHLVSNIRY